MPETETPTSALAPAELSARAGPNFEMLKAKVRELFELDKADLDFGIYRVLRQRQTEIGEFLDQHLEKTVRTALNRDQYLLGCFLDVESAGSKRLLDLPEGTFQRCMFHNSNFEPLG